MESRLKSASGFESVSIGSLRALRNDWRAGEPFPGRHAPLVVSGEHGAPAARKNARTRALSC